MKQDFFFLSPVLVVKVTNQNMDEIAEWCGGIVQETESRRVPGRMDKYVLVPTPKDNKVSWAFPGMFVTKRLVLTMQGKLKATWAVFRRDYFEKNYFESPEAATAATWEREHDEANQVKEPVTVNVSVGEAMHDATLEKIRAIAEKSGGQVTINVSQEQPFSNKEQPTVEEEHGTEVVTIKGNNDRVTGKPATVFTPPEDLVPDELAEQLEKLPIELTFRHEHLIGEGCAEAGCLVDRYVDGTHVFKDQTAYAKPGEETVYVDNEVPDEVPSK